jgi:hypothetical protein
MTATGTYVYCIVAGARRPRASRSKTDRRRSGLKGLGPVRLLPVTSAKTPSVRPARGEQGLQLWAVVADAPLDAYGEEAINEGLTDLDWVSRAALAHEEVVESFITSPALLPMKLFTIFTSDDRALAHVSRQHRQMQAAVKRVRGGHEWGVRVVLDRARAVSPAAVPRSRGRTSRSAAGPDDGAGAGYLQRKKAQHDAAADLAERSRAIVDDLYDRFGRQATAAVRRRDGNMSAPGAPLLLDAAYLVPRTRSKTFQSAVARHARTLAPQGFIVSLTGPWPPYSFMQD